MLSGLLGKDFGLWNQGLAGNLLDKETLSALNSQANKSALLTAGLSWLAQPKNQGYGSSIPYLAQSALSGYGAGQNVMNTGANTALQLATLNKGMMTDLDKLIAARDKFPVGSEKYKIYDNAIAKQTTHSPLVNVSTQLPFSEEIQKDVAKGLATDYTNLKIAPLTMSSLEDAKTVAKNVKSFGGTFGEQKKNIVKFFNNNFNTNVNPDEIANAEALNTLLFEQVKDNLKKMDATPSENQQRQMREAFGNLNSDPNALQKIITIQQDILANKIKLHNTEVDKFTKGNPNASFMEKLKINMPEYEKMDYTKPDAEKATISNNPLTTEDVNSMSREEKIKKLQDMFQF